MVLWFTFQVGMASAESLDEKVNDVLGTPYKWGGTSTKGFDCSGFIIYVFKHYKIELPRTSKSQAKIGEKVSKDDLRPGDLVFFNTNGVNISHAGIYLGNGEFAHSSSSRGVRISKMNEAYYAKRYVTARRITSSGDYSHMTLDDENIDIQDVNHDEDNKN
ncbi:MAG TPA: C40 family peptidase [Bacilli bacterium]